MSGNNHRDTKCASSSNMLDFMEHDASNSENMDQGHETNKDLDLRGSPCRNGPLETPKQQYGDAPSLLRPLAERPQTVGPGGFKDLNSQGLGTLRRHVGGALDVKGIR